MDGYEEQEDISGKDDYGDQDLFDDPEPRQIAYSMLIEMDNNPEIFQEFNTLLRERKIKKIQDERYKH